MLDTSPHRAPRTHTTRYAAASTQITFKNFKTLNSVTLTRNLRAPWRWSEKIEKCWSVFKCFIIDIL